MVPLNPPITLSASPIAACLPEKDGREFSAVLQSGRLTANIVTNHYPNLTDPLQLHSTYASQQGQIILSHLSAVMYSYWNAAPAGPSVHHLTADNLVEPIRTICRNECASWGTRRLNAPVGKTLFVVADTPQGSIIADHTMKKFYNVLGLKSAPATTLTRMGVALPAATRLTVLPFRGVLVYDGIMGGDPPRSVTKTEARILRERYTRAQRQGKLITGFHVDTDMSSQGDASSEPVSRALQHLSSIEKRQVQRMNAVSKVDKMLLLRRMAYSERENPTHMVILMNGTQPCGSFRSAALVPSPAEVLKELVKFANSNGHLPSMVAVDDKATAKAVNEVTKHAGIETGFYPSPSVEEQAFLVTVPPVVLEALRGFGAV